MIKQDILENQANPIYIGIGSNLGNRINNIEKAKYLLNKNNIIISQTSSYFETLSWPDPKQPKFLNIVISTDSKLKPLKMMEALKKIEVKLGRKKTKKNSPRECDLDIIDYKNKIFNGKLIIPHKRMHKRNFVLLPLFQINKQWKHPILKKKIKELIFSLSNKNIRSIKQF